jgi:hypothetical protein
MTVVEFPKPRKLIDTEVTLKNDGEYFILGGYTHSGAAYGAHFTEEEIHKQLLEKHNIKGELLLENKNLYLINFQKAE